MRRLDRVRSSLAIELYLIGTQFFACVYLSSSIRLLQQPPPTCSQEGLKCSVSTNFCIDKTFLKKHNYTPNSPEQLELKMGTKQDERGDTCPVISAQWKVKDDGSIRYLKATELHVLVIPTNHHFCVRYSFLQTLDMRNPATGEKWSFTVDSLVVEPGQTYLISVYNLPIPNLLHTSYNLSKQITVPGCEDPKMRQTKFCVESGIFWHPNTTLVRSTSTQGRSVLDVSFSTHELSEEYTVLVQCSPGNRNQQWENTEKNNRTSLSVTFDLEKFPSTCCSFNVEIQPFFPRCLNDCQRRRSTFTICPVPPTNSPEEVPITYSSIIIGVVILCIGVCCLFFFLLRRRNRHSGVLDQLRKDEQKPALPKEPPKVLIIYSKDHHLYRDVVLSLCAFLKAKCGTEVLVDLLDNTWVGVVGPTRWLEWQRQQLKNPCDKVLILCSKGVQAKWRSVCGQDPVTLREDVLSPTDDLVIPFLNLFLPDMHQPASLGKYLVAYFEDISSEKDVPSVFDIAVKYKLMKHFEELYFRILDIEKYQPDQVNHIEGIDGEEYFKSPSGQALKNAIETFRGYQLDNPNWFEMECVKSEEQALTESYLITDQLQIPPVLERVPLIRDVHPICANEVEINRQNDNIYVLTPELCAECDLTTVTELQPRVDPAFHPVYPCQPLLEATPGVLTADLLARAPKPVYIAEPALDESSQPTVKWLVEVGPVSQCPMENEEHECLDSPAQPSLQDLKELLALQQSLYPIEEEPSLAMVVEYPPSSEVSPSQPVEMEEGEAMEPAGKGPSSGSDQGYISKVSSQHDSPPKGAQEDPLAALLRLQEELFLNAGTGICPDIA